MVNIPDELKLSISPGFLVPVSGSIKRTRTKYKTQRGNRPTLLNGPTNTLPEQRKLRHIKSIHFRNLLPTKNLHSKKNLLSKKSSCKSSRPYLLSKT